MPAMLDDPTSGIVRREDGKRGFYPLTSTPESIVPRKIALKDGTRATIVPFTSPSQVPLPLSNLLCSALNAEIALGDTYPMVDPMTPTFFHNYWFALFGAIMLLGDFDSPEQISKLDANWEEICLGSFYIKPNYPGRSSHVCNAGFLVTEKARNKGVGRRMGEAYLEWAPMLVRIFPALI
jgi:hypothetical protein